MTAAPAAPAPKSQLSLLLILGSLTAFAPMSIDMYLPALPQMARDLGGTATQGQQTLAAFFIGLSLGQLAYGPLSDRLGRRGPLLVGIGLYMIASAACALAPDMLSLIAMRALQALGGCAGVVIARAVVRDRFDHQDSARVFSTLMLIMGVAPILAPLVGGWVMAGFGWRAIFWVLFAFGAATALAVLLGLPESRSQATLDRARSETPLRAYLALVRQPVLVAYVLAAALSSAAMFTYIAASPELVIETFGVPATLFGWVFGANAVGIIGASQANRLLLRRFSSDAILRVSTLWTLGFGLVLLLTASTGFGGLAGILIPLFFAVSAQGLTGPNAVAGALARDPERAGSLSALVGAAQFGAAASATAVVGALHDGTGVPMALVICGCAVLAVSATTVALRRRVGA